MKKYLLAFSCLFSSCASFVKDESTYSQLGDSSLYVIVWVIIVLALMFEYVERDVNLNCDTERVNEIIMIVILIVIGAKITSLFSDYLGNMFWVVIVFLLIFVLLAALLFILFEKTKLKAKHVKYFFYTLAVIDCCIALFHYKIELF